MSGRPAEGEGVPRYDGGGAGWGEEERDAA